MIRWISLIQLVSFEMREAIGKGVTVYQAFELMLMPNVGLNMTEQHRGSKACHPDVRQVALTTVDTLVKKPLGDSFCDEHRRMATRMLLIVHHSQLGCSMADP